MTTLQAGLVGYILGALAAMVCMWLTGDRKKAPDDEATSEPGQTKSDRSSIPQEAGECKRRVR